MDRDTARRAAGALAAGRVALGVTAMLAPALPSRPWVGADATRPTIKLLARSLGARDLAIGLGGLLALRHDGPVRGWMEAGGVCDLGDLAGTLVHFRALPRTGRLLILAVTSASAAASGFLASHVDPTPSPTA